MMPDITNATQLIFNQLQGLQLPYKTEVQRIPMVKLADSTRKLQIRDESHIAPKATVKQYAEQMRYNEFPPIVITKDFYVVDGNTRFEANILNKQTHIDAVEIDLNYAECDEATQVKIDALAGIANQSNGARLTPAEATRLAKRLKLAGWSNQKISEHLGVANGVITSAVAEAKAEMKAEEAGVDISKLNATQKRSIGRDSHVKMYSAPYREVVKLVVDAGLKDKEIKKLFSDAMTKGDEAETLNFILQQREELKHRIHQKKIMGNGNPPDCQKIMPHLGAITRYRGQEAKLIEVRPDLIDGYVETLSNSIAVLQEVLRLQEEKRSEMAA